MSLLKSLQRQISCVEIPWRPSKYPAELVRVINQIVVAEESDLDPQGKAISHYELYVRAMREINADTEVIEKFNQTLDLDFLPREVEKFVTYNLFLAQNGKLHEIAAAFFYGREKIIPDMFMPMVATLDAATFQVPSLHYYLKRHIEVDGDEHGPMARRFLELLCGDDETKIAESLVVAQHSLRLRIELWDQLYANISGLSATRPTLN
jgi:hypothetical protein